MVVRGKALTLNDNVPILRTACAHGHLPIRGKPVVGVIGWWCGDDCLCVGNMCYFIIVK